MRNFLDSNRLNYLVEKALCKFNLCNLLGRYLKLVRNGKAHLTDSGQEDFGFWSLRKDSSDPSARVTQAETLGVSASPEYLGSCFRHRHTK